MSEPERPQRETTTSEADSTLMGVAPPRIDSSADSPLRSPVLVRSGTSIADIEPAVLSRVALPGRAPRAAGDAFETPAAKPSFRPGVGGTLQVMRQFVAAYPVVGMVIAPVLFALALISVTGHLRHHERSALPASGVASAEASVSPSRAATLPAEAPKADVIADLEKRPPASLSARELVILAQAHDQQKRTAAAALRQKLEQDPASGKDGATQTQLLAFAADPSTAPDALAAMAALGAPGADLLYEIWTGTPVRTDSTELARALLYSADVRPKASAALGVALDLRVAEACEQYQAALPKALTDGDRRSLHLLTKLNAKRGCGPKKSADCYACLRGKGDELTATINAVKSRRPPSVSAP